MTKKELTADQIGIHHPIGNCFDNARRWTQETGDPYAEGFIYVQGHFILHGYNQADGHAVDVTVQSSPDDFRDTNGLLPDIYFGLVIPQEIIAAKAPHVQSLLAIYFRSPIG